MQLESKPDPWTTCGRVLAKWERNLQICEIENKRLSQIVKIMEEVPPEVQLVEVEVMPWWGWTIIGAAIAAGGVGVVWGATR
jgi:hypothetical protein